MIESVTYAGDSLPDERLRKRANRLLDGLTRTQGQPFTATFPEAKDAQAAYRLVENDRLSFAAMAQPLAEDLARQLRGTREATVLCVQDTTEILIRHPAALHFGTTGNPECRGEFLHSAILVSVQGIPDGFLAARTWIRPPEQRGKAKTRKRRSFEEKESYRWWETMDEAEKRLGRSGLLLHVADREGDNIEVLRRAVGAGYRFLQRAAQNRRVDGPLKHLWPTCGSWPVQGERLLRVPARRDEDTGRWLPARDANLLLRFGPVSLKIPGKGKQRLQVNALFVSESSPPKGSKPIEWLLLTNDPLPDAETAWRCVDYYRFRWLIEEYHKGLKTGCHVEERQYAEREHFDVALPLYMVAALRILRLTKLARIEPELSASAELSDDELVVLAEGSTAAAAAMSLGQAVRKIARWGGHLGRRGDGPPGWITLWRGYSKLTERVEGYRIRPP